MTNEQWLVYLWSIYPNGGFTNFYIISIALWLVFVIIIRIVAEEDKFKSTTPWVRLGFKKWLVPIILGPLLLLSQLVPNRDAFMYIIATPYIVDSGKSILDSLNDKDSKPFKLNKIMDNALDKALKATESKD